VDARLLEDMACLKEVHSSVHEGFVEGKFVVQRSRKKFSLMAFDESQEHSIEFLKKGSETKGLYAQQEKKEVLMVMKEFENVSLSLSKKNVSLEHPESSVVKQKKSLHDPKPFSVLSRREQLSIHSRRQVQNLSKWTRVSS
jgi:hypothetical protein